MVVFVHEALFIFGLIVAEDIAECIGSIGCSAHCFSSIAICMNVNMVLLRDFEKLAAK